MQTHSNSTGHVQTVSTGTISPLRASHVSFVVYGQVVSLKNRRRMFKNAKNGKLFSAKSSDAERYVQDFCRQVPMEYRNLRLGCLKAPLRMIATAFYLSRRSDLDMAIVMDCLQVSGVIRNDRDIIEMHLFAEVDPKNPRVELTVEEL